MCRDVQAPVSLKSGRITTCHRAVSRLLCNAISSGQLFRFLSGDQRDVARNQRSGPAHGPDYRAELKFIHDNRRTAEFGQRFSSEFNVVVAPAMPPLRR